MAFVPKTLDVIASYSIDEQLHFYEKTRQLKKAFEIGDDQTLDRFRINDNKLGVYEVFLEDSTRTKESFRNAIEFHRVKGKIFDVQSSSFNKKESYADTFNMLTGYDNKIFIVRSKLEGVCTRLDRNGRNYAARNNLPLPLFINAGDGKHEHPTQEMLDQFTFLEANNRNRSSLHIALIGDLLHGRTVHSKVDGFRIYKKVIIDLIAPTILGLPQSYIDKMIEYGYELRFFDSLDDYLQQKSLAHFWYFTRLQIERMGESILQQETKLRYAITFRHDHMNMIDSETTRFYHPLPRHRVYPEIPSFIDDTILNGRETQSRNGMFIRIIILGAIAGLPYIVDDFKGTSLPEKLYSEDRIQSIPPNFTGPKHYSSGVNPIQTGMVIDHIGKGGDIATIKKQISKIISILGLYTKGGERVSTSSDGQMKGLIFRPNFSLDDTQTRKLAALSPGCTLNSIVESRVIKKLRLSMPPRLYNFSQLSCKNLDCIAHRDHEEHVVSEFIRTKNSLFECIYCEYHHQYDELWDD